MRLAYFRTGNTGVFLLGLNESVSISLTEECVLQLFKENDCKHSTELCETIAKTAMISNLFKIMIILIFPNPIGCRLLNKCHWLSLTHCNPDATDGRLL